MSYKYFFEGYEDIKAVQSMTIDFPGLKFLSRGAPIRCITTSFDAHAGQHFFTVEEGEKLPRYGDGSVIVRQDDAATKIIVPPETEAFFDFNADTDQKINDDLFIRKDKFIYAPRINAGRF